MTLKHILLIFCTLLIVTISHGQKKELPIFITDSLDNYIKRGLKAWNIPGLAIAIVQNDEVLFMKGYGISSISSSQKVNKNTLFQIGSITKSFTATTATILHTEKKLSLKDNIKKWLPYFKLKNPFISNEVNVLDFLSHRTGFESYKGDLITYFSDYNRKEVVESMALLDINKSFRDSYGYSNSAYTAIGEVIEAATNSSWENTVREKILAPLEMNRTKMVYDYEEDYTNIAFPHTVINNEVKELNYTTTKNISPAGSMLSSVEDLSHWLIAQINEGKYNSKQAIARQAIRITRRPFSIQGFNQSNHARTHFYQYGLGFFVRDINGILTYQHSGGLTGFSANHIIIPEEELGIVILTNNDTNNFFIDLTNVVVDSFLGLPFEDYSSNSLKLYHEELARKSAEIDSLNTLVRKNRNRYNAKQFLGTYNNDAYGNVMIFQKSDELHIRLENQKNITGILEYIGEDKFLCKFSHYEFGEVIIPFTIENESVIRFELLIESIEGNEYTFTKLKN
ncbi:serine hydrolase domain-containing protein [Pontimicrobium sp. SW4]|uniref:Serine hydrolase domain-containing protein n=1 Tax=Pontimicrobium sp. SW4 TaxID=3153519 RepID=A0AAU7BXA4_9FLAO